jgi:hypothetical protein
MAEFNDAALDRIEQTLAQRNGEYDLPDDLLSSSEPDNEVAPTTVRHRQTTTKARADAVFPHMRKNTLTGTIKAHTQIYVINEQIIHGKSTWSTSICAFDSLHSANADARTRAIFQHAKGDASIVQAQYRNGYGTWTTILETELGPIAKSIFVNATVLQHLVSPPMTPFEERPAHGDRLLPSKVPGSRRVRQIQAFRSTDSIRADMERSDVALSEPEKTRTRPLEPVLRENPDRRNRLMSNVRAMDNDNKRDAEEWTVQAGKENVVPKQRSIEDLREFASLHTLL